jgi:hypothetical protein
LSVMQAESVMLARAVRKLRKNANNQKLFPICSLRLKPVFELRSSALGIKCTYKGQPVLGVRDEALGRVAPPEARKALIAHLRGAKLLVKGHGKVGTVQVTRPLRVGGKLIQKPRLWMIDKKRLRALKP